jgi:hypothetical protein
VSTDCSGLTRTPSQGKLNFRLDEDSFPFLLNYNLGPLHSKGSLLSVDHR